MVMLARRALVMFAVVALVSGCSAATLRRVNRIGFATSSAFVLCDVVGTLREQNPLLGSSPSVAVLAGVAAADLGVNAAIYRSRLPAWVKTSWFAAVVVVEGAVVANNARFAGVCGVGAEINPPSAPARR
jgi:hypothetical protein